MYITITHFLFILFLAIVAWETLSSGTCLVIMRKTQLGLLLITMGIIAVTCILLLVIPAAVPSAGTEFKRAMTVILSVEGVLALLLLVTSPSIRITFTRGGLKQGECPDCPNESDESPSDPSDEF